MKTLKIGRNWEIHENSFKKFYKIYDPNLNHYKISHYKWLFFKDSFKNDDWSEIVISYWVKIQRKIDCIIQDFISKKNENEIGNY